VTKTELIRIADECELFDGIWNLPELKELKSDKFIKFANLVAAVEREACATVCLDLAKWHSETVMAAFETAADAIKARGSNDV
jgi:hypothetical protein